MKAIEPIEPSIGTAIIRLFEAPSGLGRSGGGWRTTCPEGAGVGAFGAIDCAVIRGVTPTCARPWLPVIL